MKMLRVVCALFWLGCGWCAGDAACQNTRQHLAALEKTLLLLQRVRQEINYRHTDLALLFRRLEQEGLVTGESFRDLCPLPGLTRPERDCFIECFSSLAGWRQSRSVSSWHFIKSGSLCFCSRRRNTPARSWN